ncbi:EamA family transporter RarD [Solemya velum gill symbiont]|uniref:EamA family transporter RarD n=1 Tax=Solemya velum gill symbiont TaxID=2340 RepID=UPI001179955A|nr:EamA family transporter RarD [Solemya velum gill symbiont]
MTKPLQNKHMDGVPVHLLGGMQAAMAFLIWGVFPLMFKQVENIAALEVLAHRIIWALVFVMFLLAVRGRLGTLKEIFIENRKTLYMLLLSALFVSVNWLVFIWAVANEKVIEASLGYFINPLFNVLLGVIFLGERLRLVQWTAVAIALTGVLVLIFSHGIVPWVALALALTFGLYGLIRKQTKIGPVTGLAIETLLLFPVAVGYILFLFSYGDESFITGEPSARFWLVFVGIMTTIPLMLFAAGARKIRLSTLGIITYIGPTVQFLIAVYLFGEIFTQAYQVAFTAIWIALAIYAFDLYRHERQIVVAEVV